MSRAYYTYIGGGHRPTANALAEVGEHFTVVVHTIQPWERIFLDSFDWRIHGQGCALEQTPAANGFTLTWRKLDSRELLGRITVPRVPRFTWDLPPGCLRQTLEPILDMRALLPAVRIRGKATEVQVLNPEHKTVARLTIEQPAGEPNTRILLRPMRGYGQELKRLQDLLRQAGLNPDQAEPLTELAFDASRRPGDYTTKLRIPLRPLERADTATRRILRQLLDTMHTNESGLRGDVDSEFLHDFRVAVRRTRSALGQIKGVFPAHTTDRFRREFAWLGQITGPTRDLDVYLLQFDAYRDSLPPAMRADLEPLCGFLQRHQRLEHERMVKALDSARYRRLLQSWSRFVDAPPAKRPSAPAAALPVIEVASARIRRMHRRALKEGTAITAQSPNEDLHELRKTCKKLRYLMEFFRGLFRQDDVDGLVKALKRLQDNLGELQDLEVQSASMTRFEELMGREQTVSAGTRAAMEWLVADLERRKHHVRRQFSRQFKAFAQPGVTKRFHKVFETSNSPP